MTGFVFALLQIIAFCAFLWGIGSAAMNGMRDSSFGGCFAVAAICGLLAWTLSHFI